MSRKDTNTIQTYIAITQLEDGSIQLGTKECPVSATTGASFDATGLDAAAVTAIVMAVVGAFDEMTHLYLEHTDHNNDVRTWKGTCWAAGKYLANHGDCRVGTWGAGLSAAIAALTNGDAVQPTYRVRKHKADKVDWAALFDGMGRQAIQGITGATYQMLMVGNRSKQYSVACDSPDATDSHVVGGFWAQVKQERYTGECLDLSEYYIRG